MIKTNITSFFIVVSALYSFSLRGQSKEKNIIAFQGAHIFNGKTFKKKNFYSVNGVLSFKKRTYTDTIYNLDGMYVIPPFGDAHTHNLDREWQLRFLPKKYLLEGTFYVQNLTSKFKETQKTRPFFKSKETPDVKFAHQGLTSTIGHPFMAYEPFAMGLPYEDWNDNLDSIRGSRIDLDNSYIFIDDVTSIDEKLKIYFKEPPDIAKIFLINSENHESNFGNKTIGDNGLSIEVAEEVVKRLKKQNLKVYAHIESAYDFEKGIDMGVDYFAHMPGYNWNGSPDTKAKYFINNKLINKAVRNKVGIIPTLGQGFSRKLKDSVAKREFMKDFLVRFHKKGGKLIFGADAFNQTMSGEIALLMELKIFDSKTILQMLCIETPKAIFPNRKIGELKEGFEASFLVLKEDPLKDIVALKNIHLLIKQGIEISK